MRKRLSIDRIGMRGSIGLLLLGGFLLILGIVLQTASMRLPENALSCTAEITAFQPPAENSGFQSPKTLVTYEIDGIRYENIPLGQYEGSWKLGDKLEIYCNTENHRQIWTRTMQVQGWFYILFAFSFLLIGIYKIIQFRRIKGVNENESDMDSTGEEKFKLSSAIIPLLAGLPLIFSGITYGIVEKRSVLALVVVILGAISCLTGIFSLIDFISYYRQRRKAAKQQSS